MCWVIIIKKCQYKMAVILILAVVIIMVTPLATCYNILAPSPPLVYI